MSQSKTDSSPTLPDKAQKQYNPAKDPFLQEHLKKKNVIKVIEQKKEMMKNSKRSEDKVFVEEANTVLMNA